MENRGRDGHRQRHWREVCRSELQAIHRAVTAAAHGGSAGDFLSFVIL